MTKPTEQYEHHYEQFSKAWRDALADEATELVDNYLMMFPEPKSYRDLRHMGQVMCDSFALWAVAEGYLALPDEYVATEEEIAERDAKRQQARQQHMNGSHTRLPGGYV